MNIKPDDLVCMGCDPEHVEDWFQTRKDKKAPKLTGTALKRIIKEAEQVGYTIAQAVETMAENGWRGFKAEWVQNQQQASKQTVRNAIYEIHDVSRGEQKERVRGALRNIHDTNW